MWLLLAFLCGSDELLVSLGPAKLKAYQRGKKTVIDGLSAFVNYIPQDQE